MAVNTAENRGITTLEPAHHKIYVLDTNVDQTSSGQVYKVIHAVTVKTPAKVTTSKNIKRVSTKLIRVSNIEFDEDSNSSVAAKCCQ